MRLERAQLHEPARRTARLAALDLLRTVREARDRLEHQHDDEALHDFRVSVRRLRSWLRAFEPMLDDTLGGKPERRLKRVARATGASRDLEVHIEWVRERRKALRGAQRPGADWLVERFEARKVQCDVELERIIASTMDRVVESIGDAMKSYLTSVVDPEPDFASVYAELVTSCADKLRKALARIETVGDRAEAHAARIAAKRLRYLLESLEDAVPGAQAVIAELTKLQDTLGGLHDAQLFGSEIAGLVAEQLANQQTGGAGEEDPVPGLLAMSRTLRRAEERAFADVEKNWLGQGTKRLAKRAVAIAEEVRGTA